MCSLILFRRFFFGKTLICVQTTDTCGIVTCGHGDSFASHVHFLHRSFANTRDTTMMRQPVK